jgi:hypothetical protein
MVSLEGSGPAFLQLNLLNGVGERRRSSRADVNHFILFADFDFLLARQSRRSRICGVKRRAGHAATIL